MPFRSEDFHLGHGNIYSQGKYLLSLSPHQPALDIVCVNGVGSGGGEEVWGCGGGVEGMHRCVRFHIIVDGELSYEPRSGF